MRSERFNDDDEASARDRLGHLACAACAVRGLAGGVPPIVAAVHDA